MPNRIVRDDLLNSERYWSVSIEARELFVHLLLVADDYGCFTAAPFAIRRRCTDGHMSNEKLAGFLGQLVDADLVRRYEVNDRPYLFIPRFRQLRRGKPKYFLPPKEISDLPENLHRTCSADAVQAHVRRTANPPKSKSKTRLKSLLEPLPVIEISHSVGEAVASHDESRSAAASPAILEKSKSANSNACVCQPERSSENQAELGCASQPGQVPVISIPTNNGAEFPIMQAMLDELGTLYPAVDALATLREIRGWNIANPKKRKTTSGVMRHVFSWFAKEQNRA